MNFEVNHQLDTYVKIVLTVGDRKGANNGYYSNG